MRGKTPSTLNTMRPDKEKLIGCLPSGLLYYTSLTELLPTPCLPAFTIWLLVRSTECFHQIKEKKERTLGREESLHQIGEAIEIKLTL